MFVIAWTAAFAVIGGIGLIAIIGVLAFIVSRIHHPTIRSICQAILAVLGLVLIWLLS